MGNAANRIMQGLNEALAHARSEAVPDLVLHIPASVDSGDAGAQSPRGRGDAGLGSSATGPECVATDAPPP